MAINIKEVIPLDTVHIIFRLGYSAQKRPKQKVMEMGRHRSVRSNGITAVVGRVKENNYLGRTISVYGTVPRLANSEGYGQATGAGLSNSSSEILIPYAYIGRMERIIHNPNATADPVNADPGNLGKGAELYNARLFRQIVRF